MVTLKELSKLLSVSVSTVSKALSDSSEIGEETKKRVVELAKELNYKPNRIAQQLKSNKTNVIGVIVPSLLNPFFAEVLHGIETATEKEKYDMIVCISNESVVKEKRSMDLLANGSVDGFIVAVARESQTNEEFEHFKTISKTKPIVMFDRVVDEVECSKVVVNDFQSLYDTTNYTIQKEGRKQILLLSNIEELSVGKYRISGYEKAISEAGLNPHILKLGQKHNPQDDIYNYLKTHPETDAIISTDHITGIMALNMAQRLGKKTPNDISVIGFGYADAPLVSSPKISVINQKGYEIGETAVKLLLENLANKERKNIKTLVVTSELNLNETTKKA